MRLTGQDWSSIPLASRVRSDFERRLCRRRDTQSRRPECRYSGSIPGAVPTNRARFSRALARPYRVARMPRAVGNRLSTRVLTSMNSGMPSEKIGALTRTCSAERVGPVGRALPVLSAPSRPAARRPRPTPRDEATRRSFPHRLLVHPSAFAIAASRWDNTGSSALQGQPRSECYLRCSSASASPAPLRGAWRRRSQPKYIIASVAFRSPQECAQLQRSA